MAVGVGGSCFGRLFLKKGVISDPFFNLACYLIILKAGTDHLEVSEIFFWGS